MHSAAFVFINIIVNECLHSFPFVTQMERTPLHYAMGIEKVEKMTRILGKLTDACLDLNYKSTLHCLLPILILLSCLKTVEFVYNLVNLTTMPAST